MDDGGRGVAITGEELTRPPVLYREHKKTVLHLIGCPHVMVNSVRHEIPDGCQRLLAFVALQRAPVDRGHVAGVLWPTVGDCRARGNLRSALWRLHSAVGIELTALGRALALADDIQVDAQVVSDWTSGLIANLSMDVDAVEMTMIRGAAIDFLPQWYDDWAMLERERLRQKVLHALDSLTRQFIQLGRNEDAIDAATLAVAIEPLRESAQETLIHAYLAAEAHVEAHRIHAAYLVLLRNELGVSPSRNLFKTYSPT